ncbi:lytic polysaccharide monooxygenase [Paenibacillus sp. P96]|uniref:Lytic polysaccharide monooxygenase n=2 Tax=Paenibacillus zeirhizosphaerae TaxID=2987519 RepID=A0ABT9FRA8_9BACL|nr:lytic polysaccharide monooxygenase [Paenibacillus sp. P96]MDP4097243.1 lytic polysaccharide monooxygenase [Paenibacillus sp. P96]
MTVFVLVFVLISSGVISAHGYVNSPTSRALLCQQKVNTNCGQVQYEPQSIEAKGNFPTGGPADGQITGGGIFPELFEQTANRWSKVNMTGGPNTFNWTLTAAHATTEWKYYITKKGWNSNKPIARSDLELFCSFNDGGARPAFSVSHTCNVPTDRSGYYVILGVWEIADTGNAFYQAIDVNLSNDGTGGGSDTQAPTAPSNLRSTAATSSSIVLAWNASTDNVGVTGYTIYRDTTPVGSVAGTLTSYTVTGLSADTQYTFTVKAVDAADNESAASNAATATTSDPSTEAPDWAPNTTYNVNDLVTYNGVVYQCRQAHTSLDGWEPSTTPALWTEV